MKIDSPLLMGLGGLLGVTAIRSWIGTLNCKAILHDPTVDLAFPEFRKPRVYVFWHEYILLPVVYRRHCQATILLSRHRDADILTRVARHMGLNFIRGSSNRGGAAALREMFRVNREVSVVITPDGPLGPRRRMAPGPIFLAARLGIPIVAMGLGLDRPWRVHRSWDQFAIPRPFSRARAIISEELSVPEDFSRDAIEFHRQRLERVLNDLSDEAEAWATSGARRPGEVLLRPGPALR